MIMKMHSYISTNGQLHHISKQSEDIRQRLRHLTESAGGWEQALANAKAHKAQLDDQTGLTPSSDLTPGGTPDYLYASSTSIVDANTASTLRQRLLAASVGTPSTPMNSTNTGFALPVAEPVQPPGMQTLVDHPDEEISTLARELSELESELTSSGPNRVQWPENITYKNFAVYQLIPTLVYELEYPRTDLCVATFVVFLPDVDLSQNTPHLCLRENGCDVWHICTALHNY
jgi:sterol O-acyltransferase